MIKMKGWNGPFHEQGDIYAVYVEQHRYWGNIVTKGVIDADEEGDFPFIQGPLATQLYLYTMGSPKLDKTPQTISIIYTDSDDYIVSDSLLRILPYLGEKIQEIKGNGEERDINLENYVMKNSAKTHTCPNGNMYSFSSNVLEIVPDLTKQIDLKNLEK